MVTLVQSEPEVGETCGPYIYNPSRIKIDDRKAANPFLLIQEQCHAPRIISLRGLMGDHRSYIFKATATSCVTYRKQRTNGHRRGPAAPQRLSWRTRMLLARFCQSLIRVEVETSHSDTPQLWDSQAPVPLTETAGSTSFLSAPVILGPFSMVKSTSSMPMVPVMGWTAVSCWMLS